MPNFKIFNDKEKPIYAEITNGTNTLWIEDSAAVTIEFAHANIHEGVSYSVSKLFQNLGAGSGYANLRIYTGSTKETHMVMEVTADGKSYISLYSGTTYSASGTLVTVYNLNRNSSNTTDSKVLFTPTISDSGTLLSQTLLPGGTGSKTVGGQSLTRAERILKTSSDYLVRVQNVSDVAGDVAINFTYYELSV
ncbi:MAG: hypothetical protein CVU90_05415 [Firmicutes bacterium HGW-Firmicutes-15]|nr:MAG: hypothetical protein CVU90_05415 [Firmicutes bacterium HGW-Firmicutes-15]